MQFPLTISYENRQRNFTLYTTLDYVLIHITLSYDLYLKTLTSPWLSPIQRVDFLRDMAVG